MSALTLAMNQVQEVNSEDFLAVRAYHSVGASFRHMIYLGDRNLQSPTSSVSSGIESGGTSESEKSPRSKDSGNDSDSESEQKCKDSYPEQSPEIEPAIIYDGRDILDLAKNLKPFTWQLSSFTQLSTPGVYFFKTPSEALQFYDPVKPAGAENCCNCSFTAQTDRPVRESRKSCSTTKI